MLNLSLTYPPERRAAESCCPPETSTITASIVTYRSGPVIGRCLESLFSSTRRPLTTVVLDNRSDDDTVEQVEFVNPEVRVIRNYRNIGFGQGHNLALADASSTYFLILNPDVELPQGSLDTLADFLDANPGCGAVSPLLSEGDDHKLGGYEVHYPGERFVRPFWPEMPGRIAILKGACVLVRGELFHSLGGFDGRFFLYAEDLDLSLQIRRAGYTLECVESVIVRHIGGHSESQSSARSVARRQYAALILFFEKNYPDQVTRKLLARDWIRFSFRRAVRLLTPGAAARRKAREYLGRLEAWDRHARP